MFVSIALVVSILLFCLAIVREEKRRKDKLRFYLSHKDDDLLSDGDQQQQCEVEQEKRQEDERTGLRRQLRERDQVIDKLEQENRDVELKMETYLNMTRASQDLVLKNEERIKTISSLWEAKVGDLEKEKEKLRNEITRFKDQIDKYEDELNSNYHQMNSLSAAVNDRQSMVDKLTEHLNQMSEACDEAANRSQRMMQLEADLETAEERLRKESDRHRRMVEERDQRIAGLEKALFEKGNDQGLNQVNEQLKNENES